MIEKIERLLELQRKWINYGLSSTEKTRVEISKIGTEWVVSFMGADEYGWSLEEALDNFIESLESDEDYVEARERASEGGRR